MSDQAREWLVDGLKLVTAPKFSCLIPRRKAGEGFFSGCACDLYTKPDSRGAECTAD